MELRLGNDEEFGFVWWDTKNSNDPVQLGLARCSSLGIHQVPKCLALRLVEGSVASSKGTV
jgi:hypothetical protein